MGVRSGVAEERKTGVKVFRWTLAIGIVALIWAGAALLALNCRLPQNANPWDLAALLFASASFAVFAFSVLLAAIAVIGWQKIEELIKRKVEDSFVRESEKYSSDIIGRQYAAMAYPLGYLSYDPTTMAVKDARFLDDAIDTYMTAFLKFPRDKSQHLTISSNLIFLMALRGYPDNKRFVLSELIRLWDQGHDFMTIAACRAVFAYGDDAQAKEAKEILARLSSGRNVSDEDKSEARLHLAWLHSNRPTV